MFKQNKVLNPTYSKKTKHIVVRTTFWNYHGRLRWQSLTAELKNFKSYSRDAQHRYSKYLLGGFRICLKKLK